jgi:ribosomal protein L29
MNDQIDEAFLATIADMSLDDIEQALAETRAELANLKQI